MSPHQAAIASKGKIPESAGTPGEHKPRLTVGNVGTYVAGVRSFRVVFYYADGGLYDVTLQAKNEGDCPSIKDDLTQIYGSPVDLSVSIFITMYRWKDDEKNNVITYTLTGPGCNIMYRPLKPAGL